MSQSQRVIVRSAAEHYLLGLDLEPFPSTCAEESGARQWTQVPLSQS